ncbi:MAG: hypothetical protein HKM22_03685 [Gammaproteobacteria bacterium]|nr:hypothetical protein [Gammaproteobacteria bacterium]
MRQKNHAISYLCAISLAASVVIVGGNGIAFADDRDRPRHSDHREKKKIRTNKEWTREHRERGDFDRRDSKRHKDRRPRHRIIHRGPVYVLPARRVRHYRHIKIIRPYGHWYHGYGHVHVDGDAFAWLAFTAITLKILDNLNEQQQREHEAAQVRATTAPIGEKIIWSDGHASGSVTATREGTSTMGRYCREFLQEVIIGGRKEQAYGTACRQPDGSWEVISTGAPN